MKQTEEWFRDRFRLNLRLFHDRCIGTSIERAHFMISSALKTGNKILIFGNGGSAAEAQHFAAELVCQFEKKRRALPAIALSTDSSILTAQSNDYGFASVFERQIEALCQPGDVVIGLTTSDAGNFEHSGNVSQAFGMARKKKGKSIGLFSAKTKYLLNFVDLAIIVPEKNTALIQEAHLAIIHLLCKLIEEDL
ncbi:MAG: SIS domain-containing protein [Candidatus Azambacteria bacterium]|nr:SIS domain-containing protein [Candidatus Azambacteria bacterium]